MIHIDRADAGKEQKTQTKDLQASHDIMAAENRTKKMKEDYAYKPHRKIIKITGDPVGRRKPGIKIRYIILHDTRHAIKDQPLFKRESDRVTNHVENQSESYKFKKCFHNDLLMDWSQEISASSGLKAA